MYRAEEKAMWLHLKQTLQSFRAWLARWLTQQGVS